MPGERLLGVGVRSLSRSLWTVSGRRWYACREYSPAGRARPSKERAFPPDEVRSNQCAGMRPAGHCAAGSSAAHPRGDLPGCDAQHGFRQSRDRAIFMRGPRRALASRRISRSGRKPLLRHGLWVRRVGPPLWIAPPCKTPSVFCGDHAGSFTPFSTPGDLAVPPSARSVWILWLRTRDANHGAPRNGCFASRRSAWLPLL